MSQTNHAEFQQLLPKYTPAPQASQPAHFTAVFKDGHYTYKELRNEEDPNAVLHHDRKEALPETE
jgi:hypothetical protein